MSVISLSLFSLPLFSGSMAYASNLSCNPNWPNVRGVSNATQRNDCIVHLLSTYHRQISDTLALFSLDQILRPLSFLHALTLTRMPMHVSGVKQESGSSNSHETHST